jgi:hypothetical protein
MRRRVPISEVQAEEAEEQLEGGLHDLSSDGGGARSDGMCGIDRMHIDQTLTVAKELVEGRRYVSTIW